MIYSFLYVFAFSIALILIQKLDFNIPPLFSLLVTVTIATIYFNLINIKYLKKIYLSCLQNKKNWFVVMLIVLLMWASTMIGPGKIGASLFNFIYFAWLGILGLVMTSLKNGKKNKINLYLSLCLLILISCNIAFELQTDFSSNTLYGIVLALFGGTASFVYFKKSQELSQHALLSATQLLAVRFYLAIIILAIILPKHSIVHYITLTNLINLTVLALLSLIIPLYFSQKALEKISPEQHAIINSLCPIVTGILQKLVFNDIRNNQLFIYFIYSMAIAGFYFIKKYNQTLELSK